MAESQIEKDNARRGDLHNAIEIAKAYATSSVTKNPDELADTIEKTYRMIRKLRKEEG